MYRPQWEADALLFCICSIYLDWYVMCMYMYINIHIYIVFCDAAMWTFSVLHLEIANLCKKPEILHRSPGKSSCWFCVSCRGNVLRWGYVSYHVWHLDIAYSLSVTPATAKQIALSNKATLFLMFSLMFNCLLFTSESDRWIGHWSSLISA